MSLEAKLLLQEFRTLVAEFGDKLPMTERYRESLLNRLHAELKSLRPEAREFRKAQELLSAMMNITAHWHSSQDDCSKCRTVEEVTKFLQATGYGPSEPERCPECKHGNRLNGRIVHAFSCSYGTKG